MKILTAHLRKDPTLQGWRSSLQTQHSHPPRQLEHEKQLWRHFSPWLWILLLLCLSPSLWALLLLEHQESGHLQACFLRGVCGAQSTLPLGFPHQAIQGSAVGKNCGSAGDCAAAPAGTKVSEGFGTSPFPPRLSPSVLSTSCSLFCWNMHGMDMWPARNQMPPWQRTK